MQYISLREVLLIHIAAIRRYGGSDGVRDAGLVEPALARPRASFGDYEAYPDLYSKAAVLLAGLVKNHGFVDGNKRTATAATSVFLQKNGYDFIASETALWKFVVAVAEGKYDTEEIAAWLKKHTKKN
ncbi:MAG: type II toxin-antitoxin system death-on-curing family toxin [bacterium]|nr:type II toxin-antitoxin system death-on-curing family toxin [bacterium]